MEKILHHHQVTHYYPKGGNDEKDLKDASDNSGDAPPVQPPEGEKVHRKESGSPNPKLNEFKLPPASQRVIDFLEQSNLELVALGGNGLRVVNDVEVIEASDSEFYQDVFDEEDEKTSVLKQQEGGNGKIVKVELVKASGFQCLTPPPLHSIPKTSKLPKKRKQEDLTPEHEDGGRTQNTK